ncbi:DNA translocase FtsK [Alsobacter metallidurans]|uniref:DNA translocase FtsK n=1 Tax=Alsobacter metallidurans TaxID=340221 RepID=A0A917MJV8_9HYPH|nr:DNA translocase FtsK 4TM domain-containing protein [Alsobacter metallidurans]GGH33551.1 DNA translocase FtsK [Alsobacter metallidurans]
MRTTRASGSGLDQLSEALRDFLWRRAAELTGLILLAVAAACGLALVTWSVQDPSLNHAINGPVRNLLGRPGAIAADVLMQIFGLAAIALIAPPALAGVRLLSGRRLLRSRLRVLLWILGATAAAGLASSLPTTGRWPLPTGLGGVLGDAVLRAFHAVPGLNGGLARLILTIALGVLAILTLSAASGVGFDKEGDARAEPRETRAARSDDFEDDDRTSEPGLAIVSVGAIIHGLLSLKSAMARAWRRRAARPSFMARVRAAMPARAPDDFDDLLPAPGGRAEPGFARAADGGERPAPRREPPQPASHARPQPQPAQPDEDDDDYDAVPDGEPLDAGMVIDGVAAPRVSAPAPAPRPGKRLAKEAQPSFLDRDGYQLPPLALLSEPKKTTAPNISADALEQNARLLEGVLEDFGVRGEIIKVHPGPVVTLYELEPAPGIKSSRVIGLADDIARSMSAVSARVAVVPGRNAIGIELPNQKRETVFLRELLASEDFEKSKFKLALCLGKTIGGEPVIAELARMPHLLVAGTTGSGKSVAINTMILSLLYRLQPEQCRLIMVDPKMLELSVYDGIPHLLTPVVTDPKKAVVALKWAVREMEERYKKMSKLGVRNIDGFNVRVVEAKQKGEIITRTVQTGFDRETGEAVYEDEIMDLEPLPYIVVIVDEMADLMMVAGKEIEGTIQRLAQMARAAGIHVVLATQRPSVDVITGTIKANFPTRISFQVTSKIDSRTILGEMGAEQLLGQGDMLHMAGGGRISRVHGPFVSDDEVEKVVAHLKSQGRPQYLEAVTQDEEEGGATEDAEDGAVFDKGDFGAPSGDLYDQAIAVVLRDKKASTSYIQRRLQIGYNRAASLMERMEKEGIVGAANHAGKREILIEQPAGRGDAPFDED